jgi:hypothetical protein
MTEQLPRDVVKALTTVEIRSATEFAVGGETTTLAAGESEVGIKVLADTLYALVYTRPRAGSMRPALDGARDFVARLSAANVGHGTFEPGWKLVSIDDDGRLCVEKDGLKLWVQPAWFASRASPPSVGTVGRVRVGKELRSLMPGFYFAIGDASSDVDDDAGERLVRFYWNLTSTLTPTALHAVTSQLNGAEIPFRMKVLSDPAAYVRADAGVLYVYKRYVARAYAAIQRAYFTVRAGLLPQVPLFTKRLAPGLGLAEDPGDPGTSFGQHRCRLVAAALWDSFERGTVSEAERVKAVVSAFRAGGLDPARPYLATGSSDEYPGMERRGRS